MTRRRTSYALFLLLAGTAMGIVLPAQAQQVSDKPAAISSVDVLWPVGRKSTPVESGVTASQRVVPVPAPVVAPGAVRAPVPAMVPAAPVVNRPVETPVNAVPVPAPVDTSTAARKPAEGQERYIVPGLDASQNTVTASAQTPVSGNLRDILLRTAASNPTIKANRETLRSAYEDVFQAEAGWRPTIGASAGVAASNTHTDPGDDDNNFGKNLGVDFVQPLYRGGRTISATSQQLKNVEAKYAAYQSVVQNVFLDAITAYMDVQRDRATIGLNEQNVQVIGRQLDSTRKGFEVGELTRTDVAQATARLSGAQANLIAAQASHRASMAHFEQVTGIKADTVDFAMPQDAPPVPASLEEAAGTAEQANPDVISAVRTEEAAGHAIRTVSGELLPEISLTGGVQQQYDPASVGGSIDEIRTASIGVTATMPIYEAGATRSRVRQAKIARFQSQDLVTRAKQLTRENTTIAWENLNAAAAQISAFKEQVEAARLAREGVYKEREVGTRTILDTLDADQELLDAQTGLVIANRDAVVARYTLVANMGSLTMEKSGLGADPMSDAGLLSKTRSNLFGTSVDALPE